MGQVSKKWTPFEEAIYSKEHQEQITKDRLGRVCRVWLNSRYQVEVTIIEPQDGMDWPPLTWLSIKRLDKATIHDWRDLQRIKNELCGPESEAVELYPSESRLVDTSNQYHLWVLPPGKQWPFGYGERLIIKTTTEEDVDLPGKARQRPFEPGTEPTDAITQTHAEELVVEMLKKGGP